MEISGSTFLLEIINFLVLVWILKRFLFNPVRAVITRRREQIDRQIDDARTMNAQAQALKQQYESRLSDSETEKRQLRQTLQEELEAERAKRAAELEEHLAQARQRAQATHRRQQDAQRRGLEQTAMQNGARFAARLLQQAAGPETEARLIDRALEQLDALPRTRLEGLQRSERAGTEVLVTTAYALTADQRQRLRASLGRLFATGDEIRYEQDQSLLAGIRIVTGNWLLGFNLKDELQGFVDIAHED